MQVLENDLGGRLLERTSTGVRPTSGGHALLKKASELLAAYDSTMTEVRRLLRGEGDRLRIGYMPSATRRYLNPALKILQATFPDTSLQMLDLSPGEQIRAIRAGEIDLAMTDGSGLTLAKEFYTRVLDIVPSIAALPAKHPLAQMERIRISDLKNDSFVSGSETHIPGRNRQLIQYCRKFGRFTPKFLGETQTLDDSFAMVANEGAVGVMPAYMSHHVIPGVVLIPISDKITWEIIVVWQRGRTAGALRGLLDALFEKRPRSPGSSP